MQSSAATGFRAMIMFACLVGVPAWAVWGTSWPDVLKKFQDIRWPAILDRALASQSAAPSDAPRFAPSDAPPPPNSPESPISPTRQALTDAAAPVASLGIRDIENRLQRLGATHYVLETWGSQQQLYRFQCQVARGQGADFVRCFEAVRPDPVEAMRQVLTEVEAISSITALAKALPGV